LERFTELVLSLFEFFFFVENAALSNNSFGAVRRKLRDQALSMSHFFKFVLYVDLYLHNFVCVLRVFDLRSNFAGFSVHACLEQGLSVVKLVLSHVREKLSELVVVFGGLCIVLNVEVAVCKQRQSCATAGLELEFIV